MSQKPLRITSFFAPVDQDPTTSKRKLPRESLAAEKTVLKKKRKTSNGTSSSSSLSSSSSSSAMRQSLLKSTAAELGVGGKSPTTTTTTAMEPQQREKQQQTQQAPAPLPPQNHRYIMEFPVLEVRPSKRTLRLKDCLATINTFCKGGIWGLSRLKAVLGSIFVQYEVFSLLEQEQLLLDAGLKPIPPSAQIAAALIASRNHDHHHHHYNQHQRALLQLCCNNRNNNNNKNNNAFRFMDFWLNLWDECCCNYDKLEVDVDDNDDDDDDVNVRDAESNDVLMQSNV